MSMIRGDSKLRDQFPAYKQLLEIHDSILVECPEKDAEGVAKLLKTEMEAVYKLTVATSIGDNWGEL